MKLGKSCKALLRGAEVTHAHLIHTLNIVPDEYTVCMQCRLACNSSASATALIEYNINASNNHS